MGSAARSLGATGNRTAAEQIAKGRKNPQNRKVGICHARMRMWAGRLTEGREHNDHLEAGNVELCAADGSEGLILDAHEAVRHRRLASLSTEAAKLHGGGRPPDRR